MTNPATTLLSELVELIPLALVIALSPLSIIPGILVLHTPRPRPTSLAFLAGWLWGGRGKADPSDEEDVKLDDLL